MLTDGSADRIHRQLVYLEAKVNSDRISVARRQGRGTEQLLVIYVQERFLTRLAAVPHADQFAGWRSLPPDFGSVVDGVIVFADAAVRNHQRHRDVVGRRTQLDDLTFGQIGGK